jgi:uncharacterized zinc-type alcohol dehydrogenase-like protein
MQVGQRVGFGWIKDSCRGCSNCIRGLENLCLKGYTGTIVLGEQRVGIVACSKSPIRALLCGPGALHPILPPSATPA